MPVNEYEPRDVSELVKEIMSDMGIPEHSIHHAHRIGKSKVNDGGISSQPIIVRFTSFRDRTSFYKQRKNIRGKFGVVLDLTFDRLSLLKEADHMLLMSKV